MKISIILPFYNSQKYLKECLSSLASQQGENLDYEVICINDGSTDESIKIIAQYVNTFPNIFKVKTIVNSGVSTARNIGMDEATGEYITFIDADDYISLNYINEISKVIKNINNDLIICNTIKFNEREKIYLNESVSGTIYNTENHVWSKVFKREIIYNNNLRFDSKLTIGEDAYFTFLYLQYVEKFQLIEDAYYYYRIDNNQSSMKGRDIVSEGNKSFLAIYHKVLENNSALYTTSTLYFGLEYIFIKNIIVRSVPKIIKLNKFNLFAIKRDINKQFDLMSEFFPEWRNNPLYLEDKDCYFSKKLGNDYFKIINYFNNRYIIALFLIYINKKFNKIDRNI